MSIHQIAEVVCMQQHTCAINVSISFSSVICESEPESSPLLSPPIAARAGPLPNDDIEECDGRLLSAPLAAAAFRSIFTATLLNRLSFDIIVLSIRRAYCSCHHITHIIIIH
jgi:hypothetical protein